MSVSRFCFIVCLWNLFMCFLVGVLRLVLGYGLYGIRFMCEGMLLSSFMSWLVFLLVLFKLLKSMYLMK